MTEETEFYYFINQVPVPKEVWAATFLRWLAHDPKCPYNRETSDWDFGLQMLAIQEGNA